MEQRRISATVSGHSGSIRYGYQEAARLGTWRLLMAPRLPRTYEISAHLRTANEYWLSQQPLTLSLVVGDQTWEWGGIVVTLDGESAAVVVQGLPAVIRWAKQAGG